jgi:hypothetical protein
VCGGLLSAWCGTWALGEANASDTLRETSIMAFIISWRVSSVSYRKGDEQVRR